MKKKHVSGGYGRLSSPVIKLLISMKLALIIICTAGLITTYGKSYSQNSKLTLDLRQLTIENVLSYIEDRTDYLFMYDNTRIDVSRKVTITVKNQSVASILEQIFENRVDYIMDGNNIVLTPRVERQVSASQQQKVITGRVTDTSELPLPGVTVLLKGTSNGTITDTEGNYSITNVPNNGVLVFSFVGMKSQEITVAGKSFISIKMEDETIGLEEVVAIGYGTMKKSDVTGAVASANLNVMENSPTTNILQTIKGVVPGLNIGVATTAGGNPSISIRGQNSISGTTSPLIVLDGIIYRGELTDINPSDIESIDVLKDASSAAIYGSQGANGVLLISSKKSKKISKPIIEYSGQYTSQSLINQNMKRLDRDGFINQLADIYISQSRMGDDLLQRNPNFDPVPLFRDVAVSAGYSAGTNVDWWDLLSNPNPHIQNHNLSLRGRNEQTNYFISFGYTDQANMVKNDNYERYSFRINLDSKVTDWLSVGTQSFFNTSDFSGVAPAFSSLCYIPALVDPYDENGNPKQQIYLGATNPLLSVDNPNKDLRRTLSGNFYADITIPWVKGLSYRINYSNNWLNYQSFNFDPYANSGLGTANKSNTNQNERTLDNIVTYKRDFGKHSINGTFVYGVEEREYENTNARSQSFSDKTLGYDYLQAGQADLNTATSSAWKETSLYTMLRAVYTYNNRYIFTGTVRRDGFSGFGENNKFGIFPSAAIAWRMSEENFMKDNIDWLESLKLRVSYGSGGNRTIGRYSTLAQMSSSGGYLYGDGASGELAQSVGTMANKDLKWETTTSLNAGIDFSVLNGRVYGNYEYYNSKTTDLLYNINIPTINGTTQTSIPTNIGKLRNSGHEFSISGVAVKTKDLEWTVTANFSTNKNKVITILGFDNDGDGKEDDLISSNIFIGKPLGTIYNYNITGMWQIADYQAGIIPSGFYYGTYKVEDIDKSGTITAEKDRKILGYSDPLYRFSIQNSVRYKGFELTAFINSVQGGKDHYLGQPAAQMQIPDHLTNNSYFKFDYWTPENPDAKYRQLGAYTPTLGEGFSPYVSRSFIRLQELSLGYNFSSKQLSKVNINRARVYVSATNLFTISDWDGWDPEANQGLTYSISGYPTMKGYTVGLNFEF